jgi:hypothetical protein
MGFGLTPLFGDRRGFMPPQLKTKQTNILYSISFFCQTLFQSCIRQQARFPVAFFSKAFELNACRNSGKATYISFTCVRYVRYVPTYFLQNDDMYWLEQCFWNIFDRCNKIAYSSGPNKHVHTRYSENSFFIVF